MGWKEVNYRCGHVESKQMYGPQTRREEEVLRLGERLCPECFAAERAEAAGRAALTNGDAGLPALAGTPKQVAWAECIRAELVQVVRACLNSAPARADVDSGACLGKLCEAVIRETEAAWWIDSRNVGTGRPAVARGALLIDHWRCTHG